MSVIAIPLSAQDDITPPELTQLSLSPNIVDVTEGSAAFSVTAGATDNLSGLDRFYVWFYSPSTEQEIYGWVDFEEGSTEDTATNDFIIEQYAESGDWEINTLIVEDVAGNDVQYYTTDLVSMGFETTFTVNSQVCTASDGTDGVTLWGECYD